MSSWGKIFMTIVSIAIPLFFAWIFKVDLQLMLLLSIAGDLTYMRIDKENDQH